MTSSRFLVLPVVVVAGLLAGCSVLPNASAPSSGGSPASSTPATPGAPPSAAPPAASGTFPCNVFTLTQIKAATGYDVTRAQPITAAGDSTQKSCEWEDAQNHSFGIIAATHDGQHALQIFTQIENTGAAISGFGDAAWGNESEIGVVFGDAYVQVADDSDASDESAPLAHVGIKRLEQMATAIHGKMG